MFAVRLLTHFDVSDAVAAFLHVSNLGSGVIRRAIKHGDRNHRRKIVGESAGKEKVEAAVLVAARGVYVRGRVPWINRRRAVGSGFVAKIFLQLGKGTVGINTAHPNLLNGVSDAIADVVRPVLITGIRRFRHQNAHVLRDHGRVGQLDVKRSAFGVSYYARGESLPLALWT